VKDPKISLLITIGPDKERQFEMSMQSLARQSYDRKKIELVVLIDTFKSKRLVGTVRKYKHIFSQTRVFLVKKKNGQVSHSASRRNFLAIRSRGEYILFSEPEMVHVTDTIDLIFSFIRTNPKRCWYCGPVYATNSVVDKKGNIAVDKFSGIEDVNSLLGKIKDHPIDLNDSDLKKHFFRIDENKYKPLFFCTLLNKKFFMELQGLNQNLVVRGWEELEFFSRFGKVGGSIYFDQNFVTIHLPHKRSLNLIEQAGWNLFNSTVIFNKRQRIGELSERIVKLKVNG